MFNHRLLIKSTIICTIVSCGGAGTQLDDGSIIVHFPKTDVQCAKSPDYTRYENNKRKAEIKGIISGDFSTEKKWENAKKLSAEFEEIRAALYEICVEYGEGRMSKERYDEIWRVYDRLRQDYFRRRLNPNKDQPATPPSYRAPDAELIGRTFPVETRQVPGCECGTNEVSILKVDAPAVRHGLLNAKVGEWTSFHWDAHSLCRGQGIKDVPRKTLGNAYVCWDEITCNTLPELYGTAKVRYYIPGSYLIDFFYHASCVDAHKPGCESGRDCVATGQIRINVR